MARKLRKSALRLIPTLLLFSNIPFAGASELDQAIKKYYAGYLDQAISIIKPLAISGDVEAQYLLGNIFYGLSKSKSPNLVGNPVKWYKMAAEQDFAPANYALGVIYNNNWVETSDQKEAELAMLFYQKALDLGYKQAEAALNKLTAQNLSTSNGTSLVYTNESFSSKRKPSIKPEKNSSSAAVDDMHEEFKLSDNPVADLMKLQTLLNQLSNNKLEGDLDLDNNWLSEDTISTLLAGFDSTDKLVTEVIKLLPELKSVNPDN